MPINDSYSELAIRVVGNLTQPDVRNVMSQNTLSRLEAIIVSLNSVGKDIDSKKAEIDDILKKAFDIFLTNK